MVIEMTCRVCDDFRGKRWGLHRHLASHDLDAFAYYSASEPARQDLAASLLAECRAEAAPAQLEGECRIWQGLLDDGGYGRVRVRGLETCAAHRIMCWCATGQMLEGLYVLHACDRPACIAPQHLSWGTPTANAIEREQRGRGGARRRIATKLSYEDALDIRARAARGERRSAIAASFRVSLACIDHILAARTWRAPDGRWSP